MGTKSKKVTELNEKVAQVHALVTECEELAKETGHSFTLEIAYGMGGTYDNGRSRWASSDEAEEWQWFASSQSC